MLENASRRLSEKWPSSISPVALSSDYHFIPLTNESIAEYKLRVENAGSNNILFLHKNAATPNHARFILNGNNSIFLIDEHSALSGDIIAESNCTCVVLGHQHSLRVWIHLYNNGELFWGKHARTYGARIWVEGGRRVVVGDDCLFSEGIKIRTTDHHSIIDLTTGQQINAQADVEIGRHVWLGDNVTVVKGVTIGTGAIIGTGSVVTRSVPEAELWAGSPARMLRQNVSWVDSHPAPQAEIEAMRARYFPDLPTLRISGDAGER